MRSSMPFRQKPLNQVSTGRLLLLASALSVFACSPGLADSSEKKKSQAAVEAKADVDFGPYMADVQRRIKKSWFPPRGQESVRERVLFKIHKDGAISGLKLEITAGSKAADKAALEAVQNAAPFRPLPLGAPPNVDIQFTFDYNVFANKPELSTTELLRQLANYASTKNYQKQVQTLQSLYKSCCKDGQDEQGRSYLRQALEIAEEHKLYEGSRAEICADLGQAFYDADLFAESVKYFRDALALYQKIDSLSDIARIKAKLAFSLIYLDDDDSEPESRRNLAEARSIFSETVTSAEKIHDQDLLRDCKKGLGHCFWKESKFSEALPYYQFVYDDCRKSHAAISDLVFDACKDLADCNEKLGNYDEALRLYRQCEEIASKLEDADQDDLTECREQIQALSRKQGEPSEADLAHEEEVKQEVNRAFAWVPYALAGSLLALLVIYFSGKRQESVVNLKQAGSGKEKS